MHYEHYKHSKKKGVFTSLEGMCTINKMWSEKIQNALEKQPLLTFFVVEILQHKCYGQILDLISQSFVPILAFKGPAHLTLIPRTMYSLPTHHSPSTHCITICDIAMEQHYYIINYSIIPEYQLMISNVSPELPNHDQIQT